MDEKRRLAGRTYTCDERIDLYVKGACVLDKSLIINNMGGVKILTNNKSAIEASTKRLGYESIDIVEIPFSLNVPKGISFYSAHFKIDVFKYLSHKSNDEYSILLDSDIVCMHDFGQEFYSIVDAGQPMVYFLNGYGGTKKLSDVHRITEEISWMPWAGGEFIGGNADFFGALYAEIVQFKEQYWAVVNDGLFHVGDEMLTSIALQKLRNKGAYHPIDAKLFDVIYRYWSVHEQKGIHNFAMSLMHFPGDKTFFRKVDLSQNSIDGLLKGYSRFHLFQRFKKFVKHIIKR